MDEKNLIPLSALDSVSDAIAVADGAGALLFVNEPFAEYCGITPDQLLTLESDAAKAVNSALVSAFASTKPEWTGKLPGPNGGDIAISLKLSRIGEGSGAVSHIVAVAQNHELERPHHHPSKDPLTGLPVKDFLLDRIEYSVQTHKRHGGSVVLMILGLDHFTFVNDALGMAAGDVLLSTAADRIRTCLRESDSAFRLDGDKFGILLTVTAPDDVIIVAEKVLSAMRESYHISDQEVIITSSIGIAAYPGDTDDAGHLIQITENSLHHAKQSGRNQYQFYSKDMNGKALNRFNLASRIRKAVKNNEFLVYYQPKVRSDDHTIMGAEALARWNDPELGLILPNDFIPVAEETGLIEDIGGIILDICCKQAKRWLDMGYDPIVYSVNLSPRQFRNSRLVENISAALARTGLPAKYLEMEITESTIMLDMEGAAKKLTALREIGMGLSIDDFGTGYSSLSYLGNFPLTALKIDKAFVSDVASNPKMAEITRAIIGLSKGLKIDVVAEGCEIPEHLSFLKDHGCDCIQGFYFSKPVPANEFEAMLRAGMVYPVPTAALDL